MAHPVSQSMGVNPLRIYVLSWLHVSYIVSSLITNLTYSVLSILPCSIMGKYTSYRRLNVTIVSEMNWNSFMLSFLPPNFHICYKLKLH